jgi:hypothetical protein
MNKLMLSALFVFGSITTMLYADDVNSLPIGTYIGDEGPQMSPDGRRFGEEPDLGFNNSFVTDQPPLVSNRDSGAQFQVAPDGSYVQGNPLLTPGGNYVGDGSRGE